MGAATNTSTSAPRRAVPEPSRDEGEPSNVVWLRPRLAIDAQARARAAEAYRRYGPVVYRRCLRLLRNPEAARDATQDVFVKLVKDLDRFDEGTPVLAWLYRVSSNHCLNVRRAGRYHGDGQPEADLDLLVAPEDGSHLDRTLARQVLARFDEVTRLVAVAVLVDGMEHEEAAEALGLSRRSVARKLERFLEGARRFLVVSGADCRVRGGPWP